MALDNRIECAAPNCYITTMEIQAPQDGEQNIHRQIEFGMDHADYVMMRAPHPTLVCTVTNDFFPILGSWKAFREAERLYARLGVPERVDIVEDYSEHEFTKLIREATVNWMSRWLKNEDIQYREPYFQTLSEQELQCTPEGQVMLLKGQDIKGNVMRGSGIGGHISHKIEQPVSVYDLNIAYNRELTDQRREFWEKSSEDQIKAKIHELTGIPEWGKVSKPKVKEVDSTEKDGYTITKLIIQPEDGIWLPALWYRGTKATAESRCFLYLHGEGKKALVDSGWLESQAENGHSVLAVDLRGIGETDKPGASRSATVRYFGADWQDYFLAYMLGKSYIGMRATDIYSCVRFLHDSADGAEGNIHLIAWGETAPAALHAAALESQLFQTVELHNMVVSWSNVVEEKISHNQLINTVHGALLWYDLPDLLTLIPEERVQVQSSVNARNEAIDF